MATHKQGRAKDGATKGGGKGVYGFPSLGHSCAILELSIWKCSGQHGPSWLLGHGNTVSPKQSELT